MPEDGQEYDKTGTGQNKQDGVDLNVQPVAMEIDEEQDKDKDNVADAEEGEGYEGEGEDGDADEGDADEGKGDEGKGDEGEGEGEGDDEIGTAPNNVDRNGSPLAADDVATPSLPEVPAAGVVAQNGESSVPDAMDVDDIPSSGASELTPVPEESAMCSSDDRATPVQDEEDKTLQEVIMSLQWTMASARQERTLLKAEVSAPCPLMSRITS